MFYVGTSWDDGHKLDLKLSKLLDKYGFKGTFYVSKEYRDIGELLSEDDIREISKSHEIGAHTLSHPDLTKLDDTGLVEEIAGSKKWLEGVVEKEVTMFCYPSGLYDNRVVEGVRAAGFSAARTTLWPSIELSSKPFELETTVPVYPLPFRKLAGGKIWWRKILQPLLQRYGSLRKLAVPLWRMYSWESAARSAFDYAHKNGSVFHLWGHSWEIENYGLWEELESFLSYVAKKPDLRFVSNSELIAMSAKKS